MDFFSSLPLPARLALLAVVGLVIGVVCNQKIYRWAFNPRPIDPWGEPPEGGPPRVWSDYLPIVGWLGLAREWELHGPGFWVRPMLIEIGLAVFVPALYWWEMEGGLYPAGLAARALNLDIVQAQFLAHLLLLPWLVVATFIDMDEQTIPTFVTLPGTLLGLVLAAAIPTALLPDPAPAINGGYNMQPLLLTSPNPEGVFGTPWPDWLNGPGGLAVGLVCWAFWCLLERYPLFTLRRGPWKAIVYWIVSLGRRRGAALFVLIALGGIAGIVGTWSLGPPFWQGLLSSLVGAAVAGGATWILRLVSNQVLGMESLGFGDVTLMAMIGAFLGWQPAVFALGLGPLLGIGFSLFHAIVNRRVDICFGPFLCAAALIEIVTWRWMWENFLRPRFQLLMEHWLFSLVLLAVMLGLFAVLLPLARWVRRKFVPDEED